jgi:hypothetical protein
MGEIKKVKEEERVRKKKDFLRGKIKTQVRKSY